MKSPKYLNELMKFAHIRYTRSCLATLAAELALPDEMLAC